MQIPSHRSTKCYDYYRTGSPEEAKTSTEAGFALIGGSSGPGVNQAVQWMIDRSGGGDFLVLRGTGADEYNDYVDDLGEVDSVETLIIKSEEAAEDEFVLDRVKNAEAVFFSGGDQWNYVGKWKDSSLEKLLNEKAEGVPMGGTSAGLAILGEHVFTAEKASMTSAEALSDPFHEGITLDDGFLEVDALKDTITDTHFSERERMGRLVTFMARLDKPIRGIGVDESTSFLMEPSGTGRLIGSGSAYFVKSDSEPEQCEPGQPLTFRNVTGYRLDSGGTFDLNTWTGEGGEPISVTVDEGRLS